MYGIGNIIFSGNKFSPAPPFPATAADNGVSVDPGTGRIVLGNAVAGVLATLLNNREIPTADFDLEFIGSSGGQRLAIEGLNTALRFTDALSVLKITQVVAGLNFSSNTVGALAVRFDFSTDEILMNADGTTSSLGGFITMIDDQTRQGIWFRNTGTNNVWDAVRLQNSNNSTTSRTQLRILNNRSLLNLTLDIGLGSQANTTYPDTPYIHATSQTPGLYIAAINSSGFVAWSIGAEGAAGEVMRLIAGGRLGIGLTAPTAAVHTRAGVAAANGAPFKYTAGVAAQTVVENGAKNFDGTNETIAAGGVTYTLAKTLTATGSLNFPNTAAQTSSDLTIAVTGAADGDVVMLGVPIASQVADTCYTAFVSAANTVTVRFNNYSAGAVDPAQGTFRVSVVKY